MKKERICDLPGIYLKDSEGTIEYKIVKIEEDSSTKLFLVAIGNQWAFHVKDKVLFKIINTGNSIKIGKKYKDNITDYIEYDNVEYLRILLNYDNMISHMPQSYGIMLDSYTKI